MEKEKKVKKNQEKSPKLNNKVLSKRPLKAAIQKRKLNEEKPKPFEETNEIKKLKFLIIIVQKGQGAGINQLLLKFGASSSVVLFGKGTAVTAFGDYTGASENNLKEIVCALVNEEMYADIKDYLDVRFSISRASKGVMACIDVSSIAGVMAYKYIVDFSKVRKTYDK